ncbi:MAG: type II toxin-antitoxin system VapC family toxin [Spirochaetaceae bacterium]|nr:MAG: type II toxin-antitoxin system VapC family toxin [Spirochaetaceae bacterium]
MNGSAEAHGPSTRVADTRVLDTHVWVWLMDGDPLLTAQLVGEIENAAEAGCLYVSAASLWEIAAMERLGRIRLSVPIDSWLREATSTPGLVVHPIDGAVAVDGARLPGSFPGDPVDRLIVATARTLGGTLITADPRLHEYAQGGHVALRSL